MAKTCPLRNVFRYRLKAATIEPVVLTRASLDEKVVVLRLAPRIATSIRMPEPVNSVIVGDPENFQAEHSEREPELVTVKPVTAQAAQTNLLITTTLGHQINLLLVSSGEQDAGAQKVNVLLKYGKPASSASFPDGEERHPVVAGRRNNAVGIRSKTARKVSRVNA